MTANGKAVKKLSDLRETYDKLKIGKDFKLEIKRGGKLIAVSIKKVDPKYLPPKRVARTNDAGWMKDKVFLHGFGVQIGKINEKPMIEKLHGDNDLVKQAGLKGGDLVTSINGQAVKTFVQFKEIYDNIHPKQDVNIKFGNKSISFKKSEFKGTDEPRGAQFH
jgi:PDZ domain-containing secreted protein